MLIWTFFRAVAQHSVFPHSNFMKLVDFLGCTSNLLLLIPDEKQLKKTQYTEVPSNFCVHSLFVYVTYFLSKQTNETNDSTNQITYHPDKPVDWARISTAWVVDSQLPTLHWTLNLYQQRFQMRHFMCTMEQPSALMLLLLNWTQQLLLLSF